MRIQRDCTLKSTSNNDKRLQYVLGHKGKLHINNGQPMVFVVGDAEAQCKLTTAPIQHIGIVGGNILLVEIVIDTEYVFDMH